MISAVVNRRSRPTSSLYDKLTVSSVKYGAGAGCIDSWDRAGWLRRLDHCMAGRILAELTWNKAAVVVLIAEPRKSDGWARARADHGLASLMALGLVAAVDEHGHWTPVHVAVSVASERYR
jgi:hypothetical protein